MSTGRTPRTWSICTPPPRSESSDLTTSRESGRSDTLVLIGLAAVPISAVATRLTVLPPTRAPSLSSLIVPPNAWFHQHFNAGNVPARYLAFKNWSPRNTQGVPMSWISRRLGGYQIDNADVTQQVREMFSQALARHGLEPRMDEAYERELETLPPKQ